VAAVSPAIGDIHLVRNAHDDRVSISIHAYGCDIGRRKRHVFDPVTGASREFISSYANAGSAGGSAMAGQILLLARSSRAPANFIHKEIGNGTHPGRQPQ
jgi:hypothetical protein